jgi:DNA-binding NarL/FixJ family response regulator
LSVEVSSPSSRFGKPSPAQAVQSVALVDVDDSAIRAIRDVLDANAITIADHAADVAGLGEIRQAGAIVIVTNEGAIECRALVRDAVSRFPRIPIVVTGRLSNNGIHKVLVAGALGFVHESELEAALPATIRAVSAGQVAVPRQLSPAAVRPALSHREKQALALLASGFTNRQIATRLFLAESTVKTHLTSIFGKLGVHSRSEAAELVLDPDLKLGVGVEGLMPPIAAEATSGRRDSWK